MPKRDGEVTLTTGGTSQENSKSPAANFAQNLVDGKFWSQLLLFPLRQLPEDFDNLSRKIHTISSTIRTLSAVLGIIAGGVAVFYWPWLSDWVGRIVSAYFGETIAATAFGGIIKTYVGGMLVGTVSKFSISDIVMRLVNGCIYGNPDYYLTKSDIERLSAKFSTGDIDISEEEVEEMGRSLIAAIESNAPIPGIEEIGGRDVYITIFKNFLAGDITSLNQVIEIQAAVDNQLEEAERKLADLLDLSSQARRPAALTDDDRPSRLDDIDIEEPARRSRSAPSLGDATAQLDSSERKLPTLEPRAQDARSRWQSAFAEVRRRGTDRRDDARMLPGDDIDQPFADELLRRIEEARVACQKARARRRRPICLAHTRAKMRALAARGKIVSHDDAARDLTQHRMVAIDISRLQTAREDAHLAHRSPLAVVGGDGEREREVVLDMSRRRDGVEDNSPDLEAGVRRSSSQSRSPTTP